MAEALSVYELLSAHFENQFRETALSYFGRRFSRGQLLSRTDRCARGFLARGVRSGQPVLLCAPSVPETVIALLALWRLGAVPHLLNPAFSPELLALRIRQSDGKILLVLDKLWPRVREAANTAGVKDIILIPASGSLPFFVRRAARKASPPEDFGGFHGISWRVFLRNNTRGPIPTPSVSPQDTAAVVYPSGSNELLGGIELTHGGITAMAAAYEASPFRPTKGGRFLDMIPPWFATGLTAALLVPLCLGQEVALQPSFRPKAFAAALLRDRPNYVVASDSLWREALDRPELDKADLSFLLSPYTGIANEPLSPADENAVNAFFRAHGSPAKLGRAFGLCELGGTVSATGADDSLPGSVGIPLPGIAVSAFDPASGVPLPRGETGELWVDSPCRMKGYFGNPEATRRFFSPDEAGILWARTGYAGFVSQNGSVFVTGRMPRVSSCRQEFPVIK